MWHMHLVWSCYVQHFTRWICMTRDRTTDGWTDDWPTLVQNQYYLFYFLVSINVCSMIKAIKMPHNCHYYHSAKAIGQGNTVGPAKVMWKIDSWIWDQMLQILSLTLWRLSTNFFTSEIIWYHFFTCVRIWYQCFKCVSLWGFGIDFFHV